MKNWKAKFEAKKSHPQFNEDGFEHERWIVVQSKFKRQARQAAEEAWPTWETVAPERWRVPVIEPATEMEVQLFQRLVTAALHDTDQVTLTSASQPVSENAIIIDVYEYPVCEPYSVYIGIHCDAEYNDFRYSNVFIDRTDNKVVEGDIKVLSDIAYAEFKDAMVEALSKSIAVLDKHTDLLGVLFKPSTQILRGYRVISEKQQVDQFSYSLETEVTTRRDSELYSRY